MLLYLSFDRYFQGCGECSKGGKWDKHSQICLQHSHNYLYLQISSVLLQTDKQATLFKSFINWLSQDCTCGSTESMCRSILQIQLEQAMQVYNIVYKTTMLVSLFFFFQATFFSICKTQISIWRWHIHSHS